MTVLYTVGIYLYGLGIQVASWFNPKAKQWVTGRKGLFRKLEQALRSTDGDWKGTVWFHCASLGEFEQGRPVIERFREFYPGYRIVLSFYSPSGYEVRKTYAGADVIFYLPLDTLANARKLTGLLKPKLVFFVKYEYWFNFLIELNRKNIPVFIISAIFHRNQPFFKRYGGWFRKQLQCISWFFLQSEEAKELAESLRIKHFTITGDTRFDRVVSIREQRTTFPLIEQFAGDARIFLGGSTWEPDEALIFGLMKEDHPNLKFIIAPHEVHPSRIKDLEKSLQSTVHSPQSSITSSPPHHLTTSPVTLYSNLTPENAASTRIIIVDSIGILAHLYQYASISLIGGGFGAGIHNILEAAGFGNPVLFGPNYQKFTEARELIEAGGAFCVKTPADLERVVTSLLHDPESYSRVSSICKNYVENGQGATRRILQGIQTLGFIAPSRNNH